MKIHEYDVVVIGAGLAGERAAIAAYEGGARSAIISLVPPRQSHSNAAQGGVQASLDNMGEKSKGDNWELHFYDTVRGSDWGADQDVVEKMVKAAPWIIRQMEYWGTPFSRTEEGRIKQRNFGGTSVWRTAFVADISGHSLLYSLDMKICEYKIPVFARYQALGLAINDGRCVGCICMNLKTGELEAFYTPATVLATGGYGRIFRESTNAIINRGDGLTLAMDTGLAPLGNMEAVQFHPTGLYPSWILVTEGARGDGGVIRNKDGKEFMWDYAPKAGNLASRDVVSRSIMKEIRAGRGFEGGYVHLDLTHLGAEKIRRQLRDIMDICYYFANIDVTKEPIPIRPVQHYSMGGVKTDIDTRVPTLPGLYAAGEAACWDTHGFNRLGGNSMLETLVAGYYSGKTAAEDANSNLTMDPTSDRAALLAESDKQKAHIQKLLDSKDGYTCRELLAVIQDTLTDKVGIFRNGDDLQAAVNILLELKEKAAKVHLRYKKVGLNLELENTLRLPGMIEVALCIAYGALQRTESRGSHSREDFTKRDDENWLNRTLAWKTDGLPRLEYEEVKITTMPPGSRGY
ncbi:FAD-binding protein [bacterium]|nr:FAD-binding protein [candidate division CSSED10-310 bacterium]